MIDEKIFYKAIEEGREDAVSAMYEQLKAEQLRGEKQQTFYRNADIKLIYELVKRGDGDATAEHVQRRLNENTLSDKDLSYLDIAVDSLNQSCARLGERIYEKGAFRNIEKLFRCRAVLEQYGDKKAHKALMKGYKSYQGLIGQADNSLLAVALTAHAGEVAGGGLCKKYSIIFTPAGKEYPDCKRAFILNAECVMKDRFTGEIKSVDTESGLYVKYLRGKNREADIAGFVNYLAENFTVTAQKLNLEAFEIVFDGIKRFVYGTPVKADKHRINTDEIKVISGESVKVNVIDSVLESKICPHCGGELGDNGVCLSCGGQQADTGEINIRRAREVEALLCTQCGHPVELDENGKTAFCPACGTTFAVAGNLLKGDTAGLDFDSIRADMPKGAELPDVKFVRAKVFDGKVSALLPGSFIVMPEEMRRIKYPVNPPKYIYTTPDSRVNLCFTLQDKPISEEQIFDFGQAVREMVKKIQRSAKFGEPMRLTRNGKNIYSYDMLTPAIDQPIYNLQFLFCLDGRQAIGSWNCLACDLWFWAPVFKLAIETLQCQETK